MHFSDLTKDLEETNDNLTEKTCEISELSAELKIAKVRFFSNRKEI